MAHRCQLTGKRAQVGNNVSHSHKLTRRRFNPNIQRKRLFSDALGANVNLRLSTRVLRTITRAGSLDAYLLGTRDEALSEEGLRLKRRVQRAIRGRRRATAPEAASA